MPRLHHTRPARLRPGLARLLLVGAAILAGCSLDGADDRRSALARLEPQLESGVRGLITFYDVEGGVRVGAAVTGLEPGLHGFHIHADTTCGDQAGGIYNPTGAPHGGPEAPAGQRPVGGLGNLEANEAGAALYNRIDDVVRLEGEFSVIGKTVIIHEDPDDLVTEPEGGAGRTVACGVIREQ